MLAQRTDPEITCVKLRSLLFVPADRPERFAKAEASAADAIIIDLEDSVSLANKDAARKALAAHLASPAEGVLRFVRVNPISSDLLEADISALRGALPDGIVLPKAERADDVAKLLSRLGSEVPVLPIATETPAAVFGLGGYSEVSGQLCGISWGAEDLPAAVGATSSREPDGRYTPPYEVARALTLFGAHAAGVQAIETVFPDIANIEGLAAYAARGRRDGFSGMLAIHPSQVASINAAFTPNDAEIDHAKRVIAAFAADPSAGVLVLDGKMIDRPHLVQAERILAQADG